MNASTSFRNSKLLIIHADDAGLSHSHNRATIQALKSGIVNSYSIMIPCPWFYEIADFAQTNPKFDHGIHLTMTCEWEKYKYGPVLPMSEVPSLVDSNGHFYSTVDDFIINAKSNEVRKELIAQIQKALKFGLSPSHLDVHMFALGAKPEFLNIYMELSELYNIPVLLNEQFLKMAGVEQDEYNKRKLILADKVYMAGGSIDFENGELRKYYNDVLDNLKLGFNVLLIHPAFNDREMRGITRECQHFGSKWRQMDLDYFTSDECSSKLFENNIKLITWNQVKDIN